MFGERLKAARKMAGLSLPQLADRLGDISKQSLSNYENGKRRPDSNIIIRLSKELCVKPDFFFRDNAVKLKSFEYRKKANLSKQDKEMIEEKSKEQLESYIELESCLNVNPKFVNPIKDYQLSEMDDVENAAQYLRDKWNLGLSPIRNLIETLEDKEIKILQVDANNEFDGLSSYYGEIPLIVVNNSNLDLVRKRMTVAHELGHLLLNLPEKLSSRNKEGFCFRFAGAFLIPKDRMIKELGKNRRQVTMNELEHLKIEYGISVQGLMRRARDLEIISDSIYKNFCVRIRREGWEKFERIDYIGDERPIRKTNFILRALSEDIISVSKAASLSNKSVATLMSELHVI